MVFLLIKSIILKYSLTTNYPIMDKKKSKKSLVTIKTACDILQISLSTLRQWDKKGLLKSIRDSKNNYRLYSISKLENFAKKHNLKRTQRKLTK